jgi:Fe(3+) dicitrate transport protein
MRSCRPCCRRICDCGTEARAAAGFGRPALALSCLLLASAPCALAQTSAAQTNTAPGGASSSAPQAAPPAGTTGAVRPTKPGGPVIVEASREHYNRETRFKHSLPEVDSTTITVTRRTSVVDLNDQPTIIDNNQREVFDRLPGVVLAEQQNPTELNISYRGLGNPQESEYILLMQDGIPLELDWIGYPTTYYLPVPQTLSSVQMIRGGSGLLYGPEPEPVVNFISRVPDPTRLLTGTSEQVGGSDALFSSFNSVSGTSGDWNYLADYSHRQSDGQRANGDYTLNAGDVHAGYQIDAQQKLSLDAHLYSLDSGLAGLMSGGQFQANPNQTTTPDDHLWTDRYTTALTYNNQLTEHDLYVQKLWSGYTDLITRSDTYDPGTLVPTSSTLAGQRFHYTGLDGRWLHRFGRGDAFTVGYTAYGSRSPYTEFTSPDPLVGPDSRSGSIFYNDERQTRYGALFAEGLFRFRYFHLVTSARIDHEELTTHETAAPHPELADASYSRNIPMFGIGIGNDFGHGNETYLNVSQGYRPTRYLDIASPFSNFSSTNNPEPTRYLTYEAGVHGWPYPGFYYDAGLFQVNVRNRIETEQFSETETIDVNTGDTRNRGAELEGSYDLLRLGLGPGVSSDRHLDLFANAELLQARFTSSIIPDQPGKTPAYAPDYVLKAGLNWRRDHMYKVSLVMDWVAAQYFQDSDLPLGTTPAQIPAYTILDLAGDYTIRGHLRLLAGISNLTNRIYYSRVFLAGGQLEPALERQGYAGLAYDF